MQSSAGQDISAADPAGFVRVQKVSGRHCPGFMPQDPEAGARRRKRRVCWALRACGVRFKPGWGDGKHSARVRQKSRDLLRKAKLVQRRVRPLRQLAAPSATSPAAQGRMKPHPDAPLSSLRSGGGGPKCRRGALPTRAPLPRRAEFIPPSNWGSSYLDIGRMNSVRF